MLITLAVGKKLVREKKKKRHSGVSGVLLSAVLLVGWHFLEEFLRLEVAKEGDALFSVLFFNAPYGRFINWKASNCE